MRATFLRSILTVTLSILITPALLIFAIHGEIRDPEGSKAAILAVTYAMLGYYFLPATTIAGLAGVMYLHRFVRLPTTFRGALVIVAFVLTMFASVSVLMAVASVGHVALIQDGRSFGAWSAVAGLLEGVALVMWVKRRGGREAHVIS